jgi:hypothetical protein
MTDPDEVPVDELGRACRFVGELLDRLADCEDDDQAGWLLGIVAPLPDGRSVPLGDMAPADVAAVRPRRRLTGGGPVTALDTPARFPRAGVGRSVAGRPAPCRVLPPSTAEPVHQSQAVSPQLVGQEQASLSRELAARGRSARAGRTTDGQRRGACPGDRAPRPTAEQRRRITDVPKERSSMTRSPRAERGTQAAATQQPRTSDTAQPQQGNGDAPPMTTTTPASRTAADLAARWCCPDCHGGMTERPVSGPTLGALAADVGDDMVSRRAAGRARLRRLKDSTPPLRQRN